METLPINHLHFGSMFQFKAKVLSKGNIRTIFCYEYSFKVLEVILVDETETIYLEVRGPQLYDIAETIVTDATYVFRNYGVMCATEEGHGRRNIFEVLITSPDQIQRCDDVEVPPLESIEQFKFNRIYSPRERFFRNMKLMLTFVELNNSTYLACQNDECRKGVEDHPDGGFVCARGCKKRWDRPMVRYCLQVRFQDETGSINAVCFDDSAGDLLGVGANEFQLMVQNNKPKATKLTENLINKMFRIRVQIKLGFKGVEFHSEPKFSYIIANIRKG